SSAIPLNLDVGNLWDSKRSFSETGSKTAVFMEGAFLTWRMFSPGIGSPFDLVFHGISFRFTTHVSGIPKP
ncbi:MAG: hypothetical protein AAF802_28020, partial [Planctomycetota bacterium]